MVYGFGLGFKVMTSRLCSGCTRCTYLLLLDARARAHVYILYPYTRKLSSLAFEYAVLWKSTSRSVGSGKCHDGDSHQFSSAGYLDIPIPGSAAGLGEPVTVAS